MAQLPSLSTLIRTAAANLRLGADPAPTPVAPIRAMLEGQPELTHALRTTLQQSSPVAANVVAALGANRYLVEVDGEQLPVVLQLASARPALDPGSAVRLIVQPSAPTPGEATPASAAPSSEADLSAVGRLIADATRSATTSKSATPISFPAVRAKPRSHASSPGGSKPLDSRLRSTTWDLAARTLLQWRREVAGAAR